MPTDPTLEQALELLRKLKGFASMRLANNPVAEDACILHGLYAECRHLESSLSHLRDVVLDEDETVTQALANF